MDGPRGEVDGPRCTVAAPKPLLGPPPPRSLLSQTWEKAAVTGVGQVGTQHGFPVPQAVLRRAQMTLLTVVAATFWNQNEGQGRGAVDGLEEGRRKR